MQAQEPNGLEIWITTVIGNLASHEYQSYVDRLGLKGSERVIELGPGAGNVTRHLAARLNRGGCVTAVDISETWLSVARKRLRGLPNVTLLHGDGANLELLKASQNALILCFVLHEIPVERRKRVIEDLVEKLAPGGRVFVREPLRFISSEEIRGLMARNGLREVHSAILEVKTQGRVFEATFILPTLA